MCSTAAPESSCGTKVYRVGHKSTDQPLPAAINKSVIDTQMNTTTVNRRAGFRNTASLGSVVVAMLRREGFLWFASALGSVFCGLATATTANGQPPSPSISGVGMVETTTPRSASASKHENVAGFDAQVAFSHLEKICEIGPRISTTAGMLQQQKYLRDLFLPMSAEVTLQKFMARNPLSDPGGFDGRSTKLELANMIVRFQPELKQRLLFCCHYDTRPFPDRDRRNPQGTFIGANDGASGVAVLCELGRHLAAIKGPYGVDLVFFDGEEFVYVNRRDPMFLGSTYFANQYVQRRADFRYAYAILIDMVGDKNLQIFFERNSLQYAPRLTRSIWGVAQRLKVREFVAKERHTISDDHLPLNRIAGIPTCDVIDFDFPSLRSKNAFWHTEKDVPENCSAESLGKVGRVLLQWTVEMQQLNVAPANR